MGGSFEFLIVDEFLRNALGARALKTAFELNMIDQLFASQPCTLEMLRVQANVDSRGLQLLLDLLVAIRVVERSGNDVALTADFMTALQYRDLLELKLDYAFDVAPDFLKLFTTLIRDPGQFMEQSRTFDLFNYGRCYDSTIENYKQTVRWMRITTTLTKYEAHACMKHHDFGSYRSMLDIGGNSGEFALQVCRNFSDLSAIVMDLPLVCQIGREHLAREPEVDRIRFLPGDALEAAMPTGFDLVTFKSVLHDWPEDKVARFLGQAVQSLKPEGTLLIFERGSDIVDLSRLSFSAIPMLLFFRSFRSPIIYQGLLEAGGFHRVKIERIDLDAPFFLVTAKKKLV